MEKIIHRVGIKGTAEQIYQALTSDTGLASWWTNDVTGAGDVGSIIKFRFNGGGPDFAVVDLVPNQLVHWKHSGNMPEDWRDTEILFHLDEKEDQTFILFEHKNWAEYSNFMGHCSLKWAVFMLSLKDYIETGVGRPFPSDIHIDHS